MCCPKVLLLYILLKYPNVMTCVACSYLLSFCIHCVFSLYHIVSKRFLLILLFLVTYVSNERVSFFFVVLNTSSITMSTVSFEGLVYNTLITKSLRNNNLETVIQITI